MEDAIERVDSMERVDSAESESTTQLEFDTCPRDLRYVLTFEDTKRVNVDYILRQGKPLPYQRDIKGKWKSFKIASPTHFNVLFLTQVILEKKHLLIPQSFSQSL